MFFPMPNLKRIFWYLPSGELGKKLNYQTLKVNIEEGKGVKITSVDKKIGSVAFSEIIEPEDTTLIITSALGQIVKMEISNIPSRSRTAKGVILMRFSDKTGSNCECHQRIKYGIMSPCLLMVRKIANNLLSILKKGAQNN